MIWVNERFTPFKVASLKSPSNKLILVKSALVKSVSTSLNVVAFSINKKTLLMYKTLSSLLPIACKLVDRTFSDREIVSRAEEQNDLTQ